MLEMLYTYITLYAASVGLSVYFLRRTFPRKRRRVVVKLKCSKCIDTVKVKHFEEGDYIGRVYEGFCGECGDGIIESIYAESVKPLMERLFNRKGIVEKHK